MAKFKKFQGCYRRLLLFLFAIAVILLAAAFIFYQQVGGIEGSRYWMAGRALGKVQEHLLKNRPDGVSKTDVESQFETVRRANTEWRVDLVELHRVLKDYQHRFQNSKPSTPETVQFLINLEAAVLPETGN
ncbi:MAG: hypothetical protein OXN17_03645 [Candidatus Poribacteria bacterium]|nr:hypothetical protein [Candidatus Poribacteria bacterium]MDE0502959.1 hypothetical protein [Candidatus Poribacteria bacterium]